MENLASRASETAAWVDSIDSVVADMAVEHHTREYFQASRTVARSVAAVAAEAAVAVAALAAVLARNAAAVAVTALASAQLVLVEVVSIVLAEVEGMLPAVPVAAAVALLVLMLDTQDVHTSHWPELVAQNWAWNRQSDDLLARDLAGSAVSN